MTKDNNEKDCLHNFIDRDDYVWCDRCETGFTHAEQSYWEQVEKVDGLEKTINHQAKKLEEKDKRIKELEKTIEGYSDKGFWGRTAARLEAENKELREALEFYANSADLFNDYPSCDLLIVWQGNLGVEVLGKRARQALEKYSEKGEE